MDSKTRDELWHALRSGDATASLLVVVRAWKYSGCDLAEAERRSMTLLEEVAKGGTGQQDDAVRDALDFVVGFCSPDARIFP